jgi:hypothetical protein
MPRFRASVLPAAFLLVRSVFEGIEHEMMLAYALATKAKVHLKDGSTPQAALEAALDAVTHSRQCSDTRVEAELLILASEAQCAVSIKEANEATTAWKSEKSLNKKAMTRQSSWPKKR